MKELTHSATSSITKFTDSNTKETLKIMLLAHAIKYHEARDWIRLQDQSTLTKEHLKDPSPIHHHSSHTGHHTNHNNFQIIGREGHNLARNIKESIFLRVNNPSLNNIIGKFNLPPIWDRVLLNTPGIESKRLSQTSGHNNNNTNNLPLVL